MLADYTPTPKIGRTRPASGRAQVRALQQRAEESATLARAESLQREADPSTRPTYRPEVTPEGFDEYRRRMDIKYGGEDTTRGRRPMPRDVQAEQRMRGGLSDVAEADAQDAFARMLMNKVEQNARRRYVHETDLGNVESIRRTGIEARPDPADEMGRRRVFAQDYREDAGPVGEGRARIHFYSDEDPFRGGTMGNRALSFRNAISPEDIIDVEHGPQAGAGGSLNELYFRPGSAMGRANDLAGGFMAVKGLYDLANQLTGNHLPYIQTPADWVLNYAMENMPNSPFAVRDSGPRDVEYGRMGHSLRGRTRPSRTDLTVYRDVAGNALA